MLQLPDIDEVSDSFDDWAEARLTQIVGCRTTATATMGKNLSSGTVHPIFQVNMPVTPPPPSVDDAMDLALHRVAECQKRALETVVLVDTKYTENQLVHLMEFCSLDATEQDLLTEIWTNIQSTKGYHDVSIELINGSMLTRRKRIIQYSSIRNWWMISAN